MPLRDDILKPVPGDNSAGQNLRYNPLYDKIKEARREDDNLAQGAWQHERKVADHVLVIRLTQEAIATQSKDLQLAAWLTEALLKKQGVGGLREGLDLCHGLVDQFWDNLYPEIDEDDLEQRAAPLDWIGSKLDLPLKSVEICRDGYAYYQYKDSRLVGFEDEAKTKEQKAAREKALKEGKLAPELVDKSVAETPKAFYAGMEKDLDGSIAALDALKTICGEKFGDDAPSLNRLREALQEVRHANHQLLQKKREADPDPVEEKVEEPAPAADAGAGEAAEPGASSAGEPTRVAASGAGAASAAYISAEPADRREAIGSVFAAAAFLRKRDPFSPAPYLMVRGLRWGELRASSDPAMLEAPPTEVRAHIKSLAIENRWAELLEAAENAMAMPCSRAWLDLQRFVVEACAALGDDYRAIAIGIGSELRTLLRDLPQLLDTTLSDDTPAANAQTRTWLQELVAQPDDAAPAVKLPLVPVVEKGNAPGWQKKFIDAHALAVEAMRTGQPQKAVEILQKEIERQSSGRGRFQRKMQLAQICVAAGKDTIAQPLLDDLAATIENHKLDDWEDRETVAAALAFLLQTSKKVQGDAKAKQAFFERICRLDPVRALSV
jgi:type VI secretion system protein ImpA